MLDFAFEMTQLAIKHFVKEGTVPARNIVFLKCRHGSVKFNVPPTPHAHRSHWQVRWQSSR
jgi:hypothetical protein